MQTTKVIVGFLVLWFVDGISLLLTAAIFPGIAFIEPTPWLILRDAFAAAFVLSVVNLTIRPIVLLVARPLGFVAVFVLGFLVNALALLLTAHFLPIFEVNGWLGALAGGFVFAAINTILAGFLEVNQDGSIYQSLIERLARRRVLPYAPADPHAYGHAAVETRAWQVRRVMDFPHAGDLMVISTLYPDGSVAALEELIGNHGGLGGEQTDAFLFHPPDLAVPPTRSAIDVFHILNSRREQPVGAQPELRLPAAEPGAEAWSPRNLWAGVKDLHTWLPLAGRALLLDRSAYQTVVADPRMTGPALLLSLGLLGVQTVALRQTGPLLTVLMIVASIALWFVYTLGIHLAGRLIADKGSYTRTLRGLGFANVTLLIRTMGLIPILAPVAAPVAAWIGLLAIWMGAAAAHNARGWRGVILPVLGWVLAVLAPVLLQMMISGAVFSVDAVLAQLASFN
ncbi:MAG: phage holin family protein [Caldilineaceae bacterium]|jgi:uncharacterized membrane protein YvlD (DUF360 family)|nr:phage holin family protein [Caldilineaceae bacterium]